jgi:hypothetical protein
MSMFGPKPGSWWLYPKTDPRWNVVGNTKFCGSFEA